MKTAITESEYRRRQLGTSIPNTFEPGTKLVVPLWEWVDGQGAQQGWTESRLRRAYNDDKRSFERTFRQRAISDEERSFPSFEKALRFGVSLRTAVPVGAPTWIGVDISGENRPGTVGIVVSLVGTVRWIREIRQWAAAPKTAIDNLENLCLLYVKDGGLRGVIVENNAAQTYVVYALQERRTGVPVVGLTTTIVKKMWLVNAELDLAKGDWAIAMADRRPVMAYEGLQGRPTGEIIPLEQHDHQECACPWCRFIQAAVNYPGSRETDHVMAWLMASEGIRQGLGGIVGSHDEWYAGGKSIGPGVTDPFDPYAQDDIDLETGWRKL